MNIIWILYEDYMKIIWRLHEYYMKIMWILKYGDNMGMLLLIIWHHTSFGASSCWPIAKNVLETMGLMSCHHAQEWKSGNEHITGLARTWYLYYYYIYIPWPSEPAKFAGWHLKPRVSKQNPRFFYFHKFRDHAPKCSDFINAVGPQKVLHFCPVYWSSTPKHKPKHNKNILYFHQFQGVPTHVYIMGAHG